MSPLLAGRFFTTGTPKRASQVALVVKKPPGNAGDESSSLGLERFPWRKAWQPTPVFLPGESHGQRSLVGYNP